MSDVVVSQLADVVLTADPTATALVVVAEQTGIITVPQQGPPGMPGPKGDAGPAGPVGPSGPPPTTAQMQAAVSPLVGIAGGLAPLGPDKAVPLTSLQVRTAQVTRAARPALAAAGGSFSGFLSGLGGADATDGSWEAVYVEAFAPPGGNLAAQLTAYLVTVLGLSPGQAAATLQTIWAAAAGLQP